MLTKEMEKKATELKNTTLLSKQQAKIYLLSEKLQDNLDKIASELNVSKQTVKTQKCNIKEKTNKAVEKQIKAKTTLEEFNINNYVKNTVDNDKYVSLKTQTTVPKPSEKEILPAEGKKRLLDEPRTVNIDIPRNLNNAELVVIHQQNIETNAVWFNIDEWRNNDNPTRSWEGWYQKTYIRGGVEVPDEPHDMMFDRDLRSSPKYGDTENPIELIEAMSDIMIWQLFDGEEFEKHYSK